MENENLMDLLCQIPDLIEANKELSKSIQGLIVSFGEAVKQKVQATVPSEELDKITDQVRSTISRTPCMAPDVRAISESLGSNISQVVAEKVKDAVADTKVEVKHRHEHLVLGSLWNIVDQKTKGWIKLLCGVIVVQFLCIGIAAKVYYSSGLYWGKRYAGIYRSEQTTPEERKNLAYDTQTLSFIPLDFETNPKQVKERIRRRELILEDRKVNNNH